jgi:hypothetical protein
MRVLAAIEVAHGIHDGSGLIGVALLKEGVVTWLDDRRAFDRGLDPIRSLRTRLDRIDDEHRRQALQANVFAVVMPLRVSAACISWVARASQPAGDRHEQDDQQDQAAQADADARTAGVETTAAKHQKKNNQDH